MAHYAKIDENNIVTEIIVADQEYVDTLEGTWIQTSYNTHNGEHVLGGTPIRKNFAGVGSTYDAEKDAFIPQKGYASWILNEETCQWEAPTPYPSDGNNYKWNEETTAWVEYPN